MSSGISLDNEIRTALFLAACDMAKGRNVRRILRGETFEGMATTTYQPAGFGGISGILFEAEIETNSSAVKGKIRFVVRPIEISNYNLEEFVWI